MKKKEEKLLNEKEVNNNNKNNIDKYTSIKEMYPRYDELQLEYGDPSLCSIYNGGCETNPKVCFIFMNPTGRNVASDKEWQGRRSPWIGTKNIWKLLHSVGVIQDELNEKIQTTKPKDWTVEFADEVYSAVENASCFITNLGKCTQVDARPLSDKVLKEYLELLYKEMDIIRPEKIIVFGNQVSSIFLKQKICVSGCRKEEYSIDINGNTYPVYPVFYPVGNGMRNIDMAIEDIKYILEK